MCGRTTSASTTSGWRSGYHDYARSCRRPQRASSHSVRTTRKGFVEVLGECVTKEQGWCRPEHDTEKIFFVELDTCTKAAEAVTPSPHDTLFCVDNAALHFALRKGLSSSYAANFRLRRTFADKTPWSCWIPTHIIPADGLSRGDKPRGPRPLDDVERRAIDFIQHDAFGHPRNRSGKSLSLPGGALACQGTTGNEHGGFVTTEKM